MSHLSLKTDSDVSRETNSRLEKYVALLLKWNGTINLIGKATADDIWNRHIVDSLQLVKLIPATAKNLADLGSGAGLPGLVIACCLPDLPIALIERDQRKAAFLRQAAQTLGLTRVRIMAAPIENMAERFDVITARALAALPALCSLGHRLLGENAICLFPKGADFAKELDQAQREWKFEHSLHKSLTNEKSCIIMIKNLQSSLLAG